MSKNSVCLATLFLSNSTKRTFTKLSEILGNFEITDQEVTSDRVAEVNLSGFSYSEILDDFVKPLISILDEDKHSSVFFRGNDGRLATIQVINGELKVA